MKIQSARPSMGETGSPSIASRGAFASHIYVEASFAWLQSVGGLGPAFGPSLRVSHPLPLELATRIRLVGPAIGPEVTARAGGVKLRQELALIELARPFAISRDFTLLPSVGAGAYHLDVRGRGAEGFAGRSSSVWAAVFDAGAGILGRVDDRVAIVLDAHALLVQPAPVVDIDVEEAGSTGLPAFCISLGIAAAL